MHWEHIFRRMLRCNIDGIWLQLVLYWARIFRFVLSNFNWKSLLYGFNNDLNKLHLFLDNRIYSNIIEIINVKRKVIFLLIVSLASSKHFYFFFFVIRIKKTQVILVTKWYVQEFLGVSETLSPIHHPLQKKVLKNCEKWLMEINY